MTYGTIAGVLVWVALVTAPIFLQAPAPQNEEHAIRDLVEERAMAHERGDEAALKATSANGFRSVVVGSPDSSEGAAHRMGLRLEFVQFVTPDVASVGATWEAKGDPGGTEGAVFYVVVKHDGRWRVSNVLTASSED